MLPWAASAPGNSIQGSNNAFDGDGRLMVGGTDYGPPAWPTARPTTAKRCAPANGTLAGLTVSRKITVPNTGNEDFARTIDSFTNPTGSSITTTVTIVGNLGSDAGTDRLCHLRRHAAWSVPTTIGSAPTTARWRRHAGLIHYFDRPGDLQPTAVSLVGDNITWTFSLTVSAGQTVALGYYTIVAQTQAAAIAAANALIVPGGYGDQAAAFLSQAQLQLLANFAVSPTPAAPFLAAVSDTGISNSDDITNLNNSSSSKTLQFVVGSTTSGATVTIYADGAAIGSAVASGSTTTVTTNGTAALLDGIHVITACQTLSGEPQSLASSSLTVTIDTTAPTLVWGTPTAPNGAGWNNTNVTVPYTTADSLSGVSTSSPSSPLVITTEGSAVTGTVTVTDVAGNSATFTTAAFKIDKTAPTLTWGTPTAPNSAGWNNTNVTVPYTTADSLSGVSSSSPTSPLVITTEGSAVTGTVTVTDVAGNSATFTTAAFKIDKTAPTLTWGTPTAPEQRRLEQHQCHRTLYHGRLAFRREQQFAEQPVGDYHRGQCRNRHRDRDRRGRQ